MHPPQLQPPPPPPVQPPPLALTGATRTTNSLNVDEGSERAQTEKLAEAKEIDPLTLGVPGLKTLIPGDRVEVLWRHGAASLPMLALIAAPIESRHTPRARARRLGEGASEGVLARDAGRPARHYLPHHVRRRRGGLMPAASLHTAWAKAYHATLTLASR